jgi:hypothetical protein
MFPTSKRKTGIVSTLPGPGINDLLIIIDEKMQDSVIYRIRCGGRIHPIEVDIPGYMIPITLKNLVRLSQVDDHAAGCSELNYDLHQQLVERYADVLNRGYHQQKVYQDTGLYIKIDMQNIRMLKEGYTPVMVQGTSVSGLKFPEPTRAVITSGNCI